MFRLNVVWTVYAEGVARHQPRTCILPPLMLCCECLDLVYANFLPQFVRKIIAYPRLVTACDEGNPARMLEETGPRQAPSGTIQNNFGLIVMGW